MGINHDGTERWISPGVLRCRQTEWREIFYKGKRAPEIKRVQCTEPADTPHECVWRSLPFGGEAARERPTRRSA